MTQNISYNSNGLHPANINKLRTVSIVHGIVAIVLLGTSAVLFFISFFLVDYPGAVLGLRLAGAGVVFGSIVELIVSTVLRKIARHEKEKLK